MHHQLLRTIMSYSLLLMCFVSNAQENSANKYFYQLNDKGIGDHNTVSAGPDNGGNNCMAGRFWRVMRHSTTEQAVNNWLSRLGVKFENEEIEKNNAGNLNIFGHGNEGFLETGPGQTGTYDYKTNFLATWNSDWWQPFLARIKPKTYPIMYIYSCHSGAGENGAELLYQIAVITGHPVAGRTGFTYCGSNGISFEANSVWQVATPDRKPTPIAAPTPHFTKATQIIFSNGKSMEQINQDEIVEIKIEKFDIKETARTQQTGFSVEISKSIVKELFGAEPFKIDGDLLAIKTHTLAIKTKSKNTPYLFDVYNDRLIGDKFGNYYYLSESGKALLR
jgi:hypothetical protein